MTILRDVINKIYFSFLVDMYNDYLHQFCTLYYWNCSTSFLTPFLGCIDRICFPLALTFTICDLSSHSCVCNWLQCKTEEVLSSVVFFFYESFIICKLNLYFFNWKVNIHEWIPFSSPINIIPWKSNKHRGTLQHRIGNACYSNRNVVRFTIVKSRYVCLIMVKDVMSSGLTWTTKTQRNYCKRIFYGFIHC